MNRFQKGLSALVRPVFWPALIRGVVPGIEHGAAFEHHVFSTVIDIGANKGQFAVFAQRRWPGARLICFEPLPGPRSRLYAVTGGCAEIHACALGEGDSEASMHLASRVDSSSLLPLGDTQKRLFAMDETGQVTVPMRRLDAVLDGQDLVGPTLLKIDVQGFEYETLKGAVALLDFINVIYVEASYVELYAGQKLANDVAALLEVAGFTETGRFNVCVEGSQDIQADLLFEKMQS
ncbi:MAG: FkbM family methyltransferase [Algiphilus sp.]|uniref:FkbM family methyltransferase n=1 Tax=Algiphilus sp. TaxID=1872431 RepID=UPI0032EC8F18